MSRTKTEKLIRQRFGRLVVISCASSDRFGKRRFVCLCDCGNQTTVNASSLLRGLTKSCGCIRLEKPNRISHGHTSGRSKSPTYNSWTAMLDRCTRESHPYYSYYGGRGIQVCARWMKFENFLADMGERPESLTLDRIDPDGNYMPENCRWATRKQQRANQRVKN